MPASAERWALVAFAVLILYVGFFFRQELSTSPVDPTLARRYTRLDVLFFTPDLLSSTLVPDDRNQPPLFSVVWLRDRLALLAVAALLAGSALGYGLLGLRLLGLRTAPGRGERVFFAFGIGTSFLSLVTLAFGVVGFLSRPVLIGFALLGPLASLGLGVWGRSTDKRSAWKVRDFTRSLAHSLAEGRGLSFYLLAAIPFLLLMLFGAMLPPLEFDVREYHLQGPKEFYQQGRIAFLPHNVYANMPFGTEMLTLLAMIVSGDWWSGALAGKTFLSFFPVVCALGIWSAGSRFFTPAAGAFAALVYLSTPWTYQLGTVAFVEGGMSFFLFAALYAVVLACTDSRRTQEGGAQHGRLFLLAGLMAGSAAACKYPGLVYVMVPLFLVAVVVGAKQRRAGEGGFRFGFAGAFVLGVGLTFGPWLFKNAVLAGNPTYPLLSSVFGGQTWNDKKARKWLRVHTSSTFTARELGGKLLDVTTRSDLLSPLVFGLAPFAFVAVKHRRLAFWLAVYVGFVTAAWWLFTHRIDRFWVPVLPVAALLAGVGAVWSSTVPWSWGRNVILVLVLVFNLTLSTITGYSKYTLPLDLARVDPARVKRAILTVNRDLPGDARILVVGEAAVFDFERPVLYNTVFDDVLFEQWTQGKTPGEVRETFEQKGVTHVYVDWNEINRYRSPGNYGYSDYVMPEVFRRLVREGVLGPARPIGTGQELYAVRRDDR